MKQLSMNYEDAATAERTAVYVRAADATRRTALGHTANSIQSTAAFRSRFSFNNPG
jgi:hypothetical protein